MLGINDTVIVGGMESMSNIPYYVPNARFGYKYGGAQLVDGLEKDGLWEVYNGFPMGNCADNTAKEMGISREMQDEYAYNSHKKACEAWDANKFADRQRATEELSRLGTKAIPALKRAAMGDSREAITRSIDILKRHFREGAPQAKEAAKKAA